jgi:hypothetical protein
MRPSRRHCIHKLVGALLLALFCTAQAHAGTLTITTEPPGATVEIEGLVSGTTPSHTELPGGYFHKAHTAFGARLEHPVIAHLSKDGFVTQQVTLTDGPFEWTAITGRRRGNYFLLKSDHFHIKLREIADKQEALIGAVGKAGPILPPAGADTHAADAPTKAETGTVSISSDSPGSEIYIDGKFVGQTPSSFPLDAGIHRIEVKAQGKNTWERSLEVLKNSQISLHADFAEQH